MNPCRVDHVEPEETALELIRESLASAVDGETDFDASATHVFVVLGASVSDCCFDFLSFFHFHTPASFTFIAASNCGENS